MAHATPTCPRCGYDQSGAVATWTASCPLSGVCSECGLTFDWLDVMRPERLMVPGFYEHALGPAPRAAWRTLLWTARPLRFWTRIRLEHPVRPGRALLWLLLLLAIFQSTHAAGVIGERLWRSAAMKGMPPPFPGFVSSGDWGGVGAECLEPLMYYDLRIWWTAGTPVGAAAGPFTGMRPGWGYWPLFASGLFCFWLALPGMLVLLPQTRSRAKVHLRHVVRATVYGGAWLVLLAGVRLLGEIWLWLRRLTDTGPLGQRTWPGPWGGRMGGYDELWQWFMRYQLFIGAAMALWLAWWWWCALRRGFRIRQSAIVWLAMVVPAALIALTALTIVSPFGVGSFVDRLMQGRWFQR